MCSDHYFWIGARQRAPKQLHLPDRKGSRAKSTSPQVLAPDWLVVCAPMHCQIGICLGGSGARTPCGYAARRPIGLSLCGYEGNGRRLHHAIRRGSSIQHLFCFGMFSACKMGAVRRRDMRESENRERSRAFEPLKLVVLTTKMRSICTHTPAGLKPERSIHTTTNDELSDHSECPQSHHT